MNDDHMKGQGQAPGDGAAVTPAERGAEEAVRGLAPPAADAAFRDRLRERFVTGTLEAAPPGDGAGADLAARRPGRRRGRWIALAGALGAAALAIVMLRPSAPPPAPWTLVNASSDEAESLRVDGRAVALADVRSGRVTLRAGAQLELPESTAIELRWGDVLVLESVVGARFSLPRTVDGGPRAGRLLGRLEAGEVRYVTGPGFIGRHLRIETEEATVDVVGTTFAVIRDSLGTCVCVEEGSVHLSPRDGIGGWEVSAGHRLQHFGSGRPSEERPLPPGESMKLQMLRDRARPALETQPH